MVNMVNIIPAKHKHVSMLMLASTVSQSMAVVLFSHASGMALETPMSDGRSVRIGPDISQQLQRAEIMRSLWG